MYCLNLFDKILENEIEKYNRRLEEIIKSSPFPIVISRLSDDKILMANDNAVKLFGILPSELERYHLKDFFADGDNRQLLNERLEKEKEVHDFEILAKAINGETPFWLLTSANVIDYNYDIALYCSFQDITSRKNREAVLKNQAIRDPLTSLFNRRYFEDEVNRRIVAAQALENDAKAYRGHSQALENSAKAYHGHSQTLENDAKAYRGHFQAPENDAKACCGHSQALERVANTHWQASSETSWTKRIRYHTKLTAKDTMNSYNAYTTTDIQMMNPIDVTVIIPVKIDPF